MITRQNDTLQRIAALIYGDWSLWRLIADANRISSVQPGLQISIPEAFSSSIEHTILLGDSYESLSLQYYGSEHFSGLISAENNGLCLYENIGKLITIPSLVED